MNTQKGTLPVDDPPNDHLGLDEAGRNPADPLHWMPVLFPELSTQQLLALMERMDSKPDTAPERLATPRSSAIPAISERDSSLSHCESTKSTMQVGLGILGTVCLIILLSGCASVAGSGDSDHWQYNPKTGYPAVGGPSRVQI